MYIQSIYPQDTGFIIEICFNPPISPLFRRSFAPVFSHLPGLEMDDNTPLMEAGIDSLSAVEFRNKARLGISNPGFLYELLGAVFPD